LFNYLSNVALLLPIAIALLFICFPGFLGVVRLGG
jgi:hypothetical protein